MITKKVQDDYKKGSRWLQKRYEMIIVQKRYEMRIKKVQNEYKKVQDNYKKGKRWLQKRYEMTAKKVRDETKKVRKLGILKRM